VGKRSGGRNASGFFDSVRRYWRKECEENNVS
jgi:hypothetical protein